MEQVTGKRVEISKGAISLDKIYKADYQKEGTLSAQIRQEIVTKSFYPSKQTTSNLQANIFGNEDFGFAEQEFESKETRVSWIEVPTNATEELVKSKLEAAYKNGATLYKILSNHPILTNHQEYSITAGNKTMDDYANSQVVRYPEGHEKAGQVTLDFNGKPQYRRVFYWNTPMDDQDARTNDPNDYYVSAEIAAELQGASVMQGQTI